METIVSSGYTVLPTRHVAKAITNCILESSDDPSDDPQESKESDVGTLIFQKAETTQPARSSMTHGDYC